MYGLCNIIDDVMTAGEQGGQQPTGGRPRRYDLYFSHLIYMQGSSRINREEQVKVVVRLRPEDAESKFSKCVYLSDKDENELVVEAANRREIFMFDHVAPESASQLDVYRMIAQECVQHCFEGYNCCIFAYGQTGAGKTFSVLGSLADLTADPYCDSRGILPRLLEDLFESGRQCQGERQSISFSYMEIYNQQIFDLLSADKRIHQIREDAKKGVFVEGLTEKRTTGYKAAVGLLLEGERTRRMASTQMNSESSRSHAIFTVVVESEIAEGELMRCRRAKLHIVDLAGSERVKHTNVEGERLREGCSINRSLHVLGNVINSLVESARKKKHIPYRDSKLTYYLKDSLAGNSITKLLANVHTSRNYFGDTLSTLMFAKRAKILKMKVELNETSVGNFDALRKEVRRLREELAQARYFKNSNSESKSQERPESADTVRGELEEVDAESVGKEDTLKVLQENELHYKTLLQIYEEHMKTCLTSSHLQRKQNINIVNEWRKLERRNIALTTILKRLPAFTSIYRENLLLRQSNAKQPPPPPPQPMPQQGISILPQPENTSQPFNSLLESAIAFYEKILGETEQRFRESLDILQRSYSQLESECRQKDRRIRDLRKRKEYAPEIEELKNENEYLHLSILNLEDEIAKLQENEQRMRLELRETSRSSPSKSDSRQLQEKQDDFEAVYAQLLEIRSQAVREAQLYEVERSEVQLLLQKAQAEISRLALEVTRLRSKQQSRSKSKRKSPQKTGTISVDPSTPIKEEMLFSSKTIKIQNDEVKSLQQNFTKEVLVLKMEIKRKQKEVNDLRGQLELYANGDRKIEDEFGKSLQEIIEDYRKVDQRRTLLQSKSVKVLQQWREDASRRTSRLEEDKPEEKYSKPPDPKRKGNLPAK